MPYVDTYYFKPCREDRMNWAVDC